jgi:hypothetical protein
VSLATAYALGDGFAIRHSLHRKPTEAKGFYAVYFGLIVLAAALVLTPGTPLGLLTNLVQTLAGVLLPSATVFLLLLCNDKAVLGPRVNSRGVNLFTGAVIAALVMLSVILTVSVLFPGITEWQILAVLTGGAIAAILTVAGVKLYERRHESARVIATEQLDESPRDNWRMPLLADLAPARLTLLNRVWMSVLRAYLAIAAGLLVFKMLVLLKLT